MRKKKEREEEVERSDRTLSSLAKENEEGDADLGM